MDFPFSSSFFITDTTTSRPTSSDATPKSETEHHQDDCVRTDVVLQEGSLMQSTSSTSVLAPGPSVVGSWFPASSFNAIMYGYAPPSTMPLWNPYGTIPYQPSATLKHAFQARAISTPKPVKEKKKRGRPKGRLNNKTLVRLEEEKKRQQDQGQSSTTNASESTRESLVGSTSGALKVKRMYRRRQVQQQTQARDSQQDEVATENDTAVDVARSQTQSGMVHLRRAYKRSRVVVNAPPSANESVAQRKLRLNAEAARRCRMKRAAEMALVMKRVHALEADIHRLSTIITQLGGTVPDDLEAKISSSSTVPPSSKKRRVQQTYGDGTHTASQRAIPNCMDCDV